MITSLFHFLGHALFRPLGWLCWAAMFVVVFGACHLLGWRDDTAILSGTLAPGSELTMVRGLIYLASYFAAVLLSPILILAAGLFVLADKSLAAKRSDVK
jgi:hypothetical protein